MMLFVIECVFASLETFTLQGRLCTIVRQVLDILCAGDDAVRLADRMGELMLAFHILCLWTSTQNAPHPNFISVATLSMV